MGEEQRVKVRPTVLGPRPHVAVKRPRGRGTVIDRPHLGAFAFDDCHSLIEVELVNTDRAGFGDAYATVEQEPD